MNILRIISKKLSATIESDHFFRVLMIIFGVEAVWIALTGQYPMAFDENFHFGLIQIYSHHLSPFLNGQPAGGDAYGAVARDPSYLYHYLMSFPYRLIEVFTHDQTIQVIMLRFINIGLFLSSLPIFRRLLQRAGASRTVTNVCFAVFILVPVAPLLAAQINYDNLLLPLVATTLLLALNISEDLGRTSRVNFTKLGVLAMLCLLSSLIKYAFLPIFLAIVMFLLWRFWVFQHQKKRLRRATADGLRQLTKVRAAVLLLGIALGLLLFGQRYVVNAVDYHQLIPDCRQVLSVKQCTAYGPWDRDYNLELTKSATATSSPFSFSGDWFYGMWLRLFFAVDGPDTGFQTRGPLFLPAVGAIAFVGVGLVFLVLYWRRLWQRLDHALLGLIVLTLAVYVGSLWIDEYRDFLATGQSVAINGRYLLPVLLPFLLLLALAYREFFRVRPAFRAATVYALLVCLIWGGGTLTYILRSNDQWYWPSPVVRSANHAVQRVVGPVTPGNTHPTAFMK
jgi:hypothetical protein